MKKTGLLRPRGADTEIVMQSCWGVHWKQNHSHLGFRMRSRDGTYCNHQLVSQLKSFTAAHCELFLWFVKWWYTWAEIETKHRNPQQIVPIPHVVCDAPVYCPLKPPTYSKRRVTSSAFAVWCDEWTACALLHKHINGATWLLSSDFLGCMSGWIILPGLGETALLCSTSAKATVVLQSSKASLLSATHTTCTNKGFLTTSGWWTRFKLHRERAEYIFAR